MRSLILALLLLAPASQRLQAQAPSLRQTELLNGAGWQFTGAGDGAALPALGSDAFVHAAWSNVTVPHIFQTRSAYDTLAKGWYRRQVTVELGSAGKEFYLVFEGAASIADVYVNGQHLGQHRGAYTRFVFDATKALHPGAGNELDVLVDDSPENTLDCLPISQTGLYKVWGGLYRNVWLVATAPVHIDPTDDAAPGVYLTPKDVSEQSAGLNVRVLLRNDASSAARAEVRARILDPSGAEVRTLTAPATLAPQSRTTVELSTTIEHPQLWEALHGRLYHVETSVYVNNQPVDEVTEATGFRWLNWDWKGGSVTLNGKPIHLYGANLHQETELKGSAVSPEDLKANFDTMQDLGMNFLRLPHYPHAALEYDLADQHGILCWAENGHSNSKDIVSPTASQITTELVKQNYNHPSIVIWSMGNESNAAVADECVPIAKALDTSRPVCVANMKSELADFHTRHCYYGWYGPDLAGFKPGGFITEIGGGGVVTTHCDYGQCDWNVNKYEPEEYQQIVEENNFQKAFHGDDGHLGLFVVWCLREFSDMKYKGPVGINSKGLITYAGDKKDVYYLYRCFLRPTEPTLHITSKRYFLRQGAVDNGVKVYSNAAKVTLTLNGQKVSTLGNGQYVIPNGPWVVHPERKKKVNGVEPPAATPRAYEPEKVDNVFYWPVPLRTGKNVVTATDDGGHSDTATIYFYGNNGLPELPHAPLPISNLASSNPANPAHYMDMPVQAQWPIYSDLDSTADNSWDTLPREVEGASWIALRRVTKPDKADPSAKPSKTPAVPDQSTNLSFTATKPENIYVVATKGNTPPAFAGAQFKEVPSAAGLWRDNALQLVPMQLFVHQAAAGEKINLALGDRDAVVLIK